MAATSRRSKNMSETSVKASIGLANLKSALRIVAAAIEHKTTIPILQCVRMEQMGKGLSLEGTSLEVFIRAIIPEMAGPAKPILTPAEKFTAWTKLLSGETVSISATAARATVQCGRARATLPVMPAAHWPATDVYGIRDNSVTLTQGSIARALRFALISVSDDASRFALNGIQAEGDGTTLRLVSTDGYCLTIYALPCDARVNMLLPGSFVKALLPLLNDEDGGVDLAFDEHAILASIDADMRVDVAGKKITGSFPQWKAVYPNDARTEVTVSVADLEASLERCLLLSDENSKAIDLRFAGEITISAASALNGEAKETVDCQGAPANELHTRINGGYLRDLLKKLSGEIRIALPDHNKKALLFKAEPHEGESVEYIVMPMQVTNA
jgi:DNA polymerase-3 subunit beta